MGHGSWSCPLASLTDVGQNTVCAYLTHRKEGGWRIHRFRVMKLHLSRPCKRLGVGPAGSNLRTAQYKSIMSFMGSGMEYSSRRSTLKLGGFINHDSCTSHVFHRLLSLPPQILNKRSLAGKSLTQHLKKNDNKW